MRRSRFVHQDTLFSQCLICIAWLINFKSHTLGMVSFNSHIGAWSFSFRMNIGAYTQSILHPHTHQIYHWITTCIQTITHADRLKHILEVHEKTELEIPSPHDGLAASVNFPFLERFLRCNRGVHTMKAQPKKVLHSENHRYIVTSPEMQQVIESPIFNHWLRLMHKHENIHPFKKSS